LGARRRGWDEEAEGELSLSFLEGGGEVPSASSDE